ncbi:MAG: hypothetical protein IKM70_07495 [Firmicutes bacterium]|nr:hypothetical protein [Bacillota bacterium]
MRSQHEIAARISEYKERLAYTLAEKELLGKDAGEYTDLIILALVDKLEALFWVLEMPLPEDDLLDHFSGVRH